MENMAPKLDKAFISVINHNTVGKKVEKNMMKCST
jgi:hypothetical protein